MKRGVVLGCLWLVSGCYVGLPVPDQEAYSPLSELVQMDETVVRLYASPLAGLGPLAVHTYFVVKEADSTAFECWEGASSAIEVWGYLRNYLYAPRDDWEYDDGYVLAELIGSAAEPVVDFITTYSLDYPYKDLYYLISGPNCNTYSQWVLNSTGWAVELPPAAIGKDFWSGDDRP